MENSDGEVAVAKVGLAALAQAQSAFAGAAPDFGVTDQDDVQLALFRPRLLTARAFLDEFAVGC